MAAYNFNTNAGQESVVTNARTAYNLANPQNLQADNPAFVLFLLTGQITQFALQQTAVKATLAPADKAKAITLLNAVIAGTVADKTDASTLLAAVQAAS